MICAVVILFMLSLQGYVYLLYIYKRLYEISQNYIVNRKLPSSLTFQYGQSHCNCPNREQSQIVYPRFSVEFHFIIQETFVYYRCWNAMHKTTAEWAVGRERIYIYLPLLLAFPNFLHCASLQRCCFFLFCFRSFITLQHRIESHSQSIHGRKQQNCEVTR